MNALATTMPRATATPCPPPSDKEIALLAFKHWKDEGCLHLRPEHWLTAEKELLAAYASEGRPMTPVDADRLDDFWERETEEASCYAMDSELSLATRGWS
ncbi:hypothetical protein [Prosthecobacter sp.]|uniref:hypothetical protein n=1 Tax=Prosthecobacter sp. TaxID=1965333 RepID=UPI003784B20E